MQRINEPALYQHSGHFGVLQYVKVLGLPYPPEWKGSEALAEALRDALSKLPPVHAPMEDPDFTAAGLAIVRGIGIRVGIDVDGEKYIAEVSIRSAHSLEEINVLVGAPCKQGFHPLLFEDSFQLKYDPERDVFLPVLKEGGTGITPPMPGVESYD